MTRSYAILCLLTFVFCSQINGQIPFVPAYIIDNDGNKSECLIKNLDWTYNPESFEYKLDENSETLVVQPSQIREFSILGRSKFIRYQLNAGKKTKPVFLKVLIDGGANLYAYENDKRLRLFYSKDNVLTREDQIISINENNFKNQIKKDLDCSGIGVLKSMSVKYTIKSMKKYFTSLNKCRNKSSIEYEIDEEEEMLNISIKPGMRSRGLGISHAWRDRTVNFGNKIGYTIGAEAEIIAPIKSWNWSLVIEPTFQYYKGESEMVYLKTGTFTRSTVVTVDYKSIEIPVGYRHLFFLKNKSRLFLDAFYILDMPFGSTVTAERLEIINLDAGVSQSVSFGAGYNFRNKLSAEFRYGANRQLLGEEISWYSDYDSFSLILGITIF